MQRQWMKDLRERSPRVHCITNYVTAGDVANMVLAAGGSPVMAQGLHEVEDVTSICSSLVLNLGTLEERTIPAMEAAGRKAAGLGLPVILDPVGVTASRILWNLNPYGLSPYYWLQNVSHLLRYAETGCLLP